MLRDNYLSKSKIYLAKKKELLRQIMIIMLFFLTAACTEKKGDSLTQEQKTVVSPPATQHLLEGASPSSIPPSPTQERQNSSISGTDTNSIFRIPEDVNEQLKQAGGGYFLLRFNKISLDETTQSKLKEAKVVLFDYVPKAAYYAYLPSEAVPALEELMQAGLLKGVELIPAKSKIVAGLQEKIQVDPQQRVEIIVQFFEEISPDTKQQLERMMQVTAYSFGPVNFARGTATAADIEKIASLTFVKKVEEQPVNKLF